MPWAGIEQSAVWFLLGAANRDGDRLPCHSLFFVAGWYQDENGDWFNEFDWHVDENGEYYYGDERGYEGWYQDANGEWISPEEAQPAPAAQTAKPANGSVVKSADATAASSVVKLSESSEESSASKSSSQVKFGCNLAFIICHSLQKSS